MMMALTCLSLTRLSRVAPISSVEVRPLERSVMPTRRAWTPKSRMPRNAENRHDRDPSGQNDAVAAPCRLLVDGLHRGQQGRFPAAALLLDALNISFGNRPAVGPSLKERLDFQQLGRQQRQRFTRE